MKVFTLGHLARRMGRSPGQIELAIRTLEIEPALEINGQQHFSLEDEALIDAHCRRSESEATPPRPVAKGA